MLDRVYAVTLCHLVGRCVNRTVRLLQYAVAFAWRLAYIERQSRAEGTRGMLRRPQFGVCGEVALILGSCTVEAQVHPVYEPSDPNQEESAGAPVEDGVGLHGAVGSVDVRYERGRMPQTDDSKEWSAAAWRGERVHGQFVLWTETGAKRTRLLATQPMKDF